MFSPFLNFRLGKEIERSREKSLNANITIGGSIRTPRIRLLDNKRKGRLKTAANPLTSHVSTHANKSTTMIIKPPQLASASKLSPSFVAQIRYPIRAINIKTQITKVRVIIFYSTLSWVPCTSRLCMRFPACFRVSASNLQKEGYTIFYSAGDLTPLISATHTRLCENITPASFDY